MNPYITHLLLALGCLFLGGFLALWLRPRGDAFMETTYIDSEGMVDDASTRDPWEVQRIVMAASGQQMPAEPALTKGVLLDGALVLEEVGETIEALQKLVRTVTGERGLFTDDHEMQALEWVRARFEKMANELVNNARLARDDIAMIESLYMPLSDEEAIELLDGTTDTTVVNCGLALSAGLPGMAAYEEVQGSNLSKRNPDTGVIDKTPDGKWIKGREYRPPQLAAVLEWARDARAFEDTRPAAYKDMTPA